MTEGDRICPYCIKPMDYLEHYQCFYCQACNIEVRIKELPTKMAKPE